MPAPLDFYFDFSSPYGYFASTRIDALARELGRDARWHPILLGPIFKATGTVPLVQIPLKGDYSRLDIARTARLHGIPFKMPDPFPIATVAPARVMLHVGQDNPALAKAYARRVLHAYYVDNKAIGQTEEALRLAGGLGIDTGALAEAIASEAVKTLLRQANDTAIERGVFGSPFILIDGEPFWGFDRLETIRLWARDPQGRAPTGS
ncbi:2-hydroxychromene-2-carboxylate isomerase [Castellaniella sp. GW247-6E4]|uniref:2-hydroxychromene-2-carboxylate isomerase n=1 Tax=Castellaniella sp. GW247-6E4 TaxID=3140380 RepID=UPI0033156C28